MGLTQEIDRFADGADVLKVGLHEVRGLLELSNKVSTVVLRKMARCPSCVAKMVNAATMLVKALVEATDCSGPEWM